MRTRLSTTFKIYREAASSIFEFEEFGLREAVLVVIKPILPSLSGLGFAVQMARQEVNLERWFSVGGTVADSGHYRAVTHFLVWLARLFGARVARPVYLPSNDYTAVAEYIAQRQREGKSCVLRGAVSQVTRVTSAALSSGIDITGCIILVGGEALTPAKRQVIESAGAEVFPAYGMHELGGIGRACRHMKEGNAVHFRKDSLALITRPVPAPDSTPKVSSLIFTTLLPFAPLFLINAEMGDTGAVETAECDCAFTRMAMDQLITNIGPTSKVTVQGMTLLKSDVARILEERLPLRFGGRPGDFQLIERESADQGQVELRVSSCIACDLAKVKEVFLKELGGIVGGALAARHWRHSDVVVVLRAQPLETLTGKVHSVWLAANEAAVQFGPIVTRG